MRKLPTRPPRRKTSPLEDLGEGMRFVRGERRIQGLVALTGAASLFGFPFLTMMPAFARDIFGVGPGGLGAMLAVSGGGSVIGALVLAARSRQEGRGRSAAVAGVVFALALCAFAISRSLATAVPALVIAGWGMVTVVATANTVIQSIVPDELRGRVMSLFSLVLLGMMPLGNIMVGSLASVAGTGPAVTMAGAALAAAVGVIVFFRPDFLKV